jgi:hypothetical protein
MPSRPTARDEADPGQWLGDTPMLNLRDDKLRLRVKTVLQFSRTDADKLRSICKYVASIPFNVPAFAGWKRTRITLAQRHSVGWYSKAALFEAMLRTAGFPARVRMIKVDNDMFRGLASTGQVFVLPVVEVWTQGRWLITDNYVYDPRYLAAAREALERKGWRSGYGIHLDGQSRWDGESDALIMIAPDRSAPGLPPEYLGVYDDPAEYAQQMKQTSVLRWFSMVMRNRIMSIRMNGRVRRLRREAGA